MKKKLPFAGVLLSPIAALWLIVSTYIESLKPTGEIIIAFVMFAGLGVLFCTILFLVSLGIILRERADEDR